MASKKDPDDTNAPKFKVGPTSSKPVVKVKNIPKPDAYGSTAHKKKFVKFQVFRDDPADPFKPNSEDSIHKLAKNPPKDAIAPEDELLIQAVGADLDRSLSVEEIITFPYPQKKYSTAITDELERMPTWLRPMLEVRMDVIKKHFQNDNDVIKFLRTIANRIDIDYRSNLSTFNGPISGDMTGQVDYMESKAIEAFTEQSNLGEGRTKSTDFKSEVAKRPGQFKAFWVASIAAKWKRRRMIDRFWKPESVQRAAKKLRRALIVKPAVTDLAYALESQIKDTKGASSDEDNEEKREWKKRLKEGVEKKQADKELRREIKENMKREKTEKAAKLKKAKREKLDQKKKARAEKKKRLREAKAKKAQAKKKGKGKDKNKISEEEKAADDAVATEEAAVEQIIEEIEKLEEDEKKEKEKEKAEKLAESKAKEGKDSKAKKKQSLIKEKEAAKEEKKKKKRLTKSQKYKLMMHRGHFRRQSKLFYSGCGDPVDKPKRLEHHYRRDESFHAYIVTLVASTFFKALVICIILLNAVILTLETIDTLEENYVFFEYWDEFFLAFYLLEAILKIYAHPYRYWTSGFNIFDFVILLISITKSILDWVDFADVTALRVLLIVRALRVLRGISLSVQMQVLVAALVETIKTNVLSIVLLLVLLVYIAAIVAFYFFGDKPGLVETWGRIGAGMLHMIAFVTLDGWYDLMESFEEAGYETAGRIFNLICIVLGNFMFSNIFIAIIILNISEATDVFRDKIQKERDEGVRRKKEFVFRRQKLDMRQLLARQQHSLTADFYSLAGHFQTLLRHDDLVAMEDVCSAPLWIDACYQCMLRGQHTCNLLMNIHRQMADNLLEQQRLRNESKMEVKTLRRGRYNRYMKLKAKLALIKQEILRMRGPPKANLRLRFDREPSPPQASESTATPTAKNKAPTPEPIKKT